MLRYQLGSSRESTRLVGSAYSQLDRIGQSRRYRSSTSLSTILVERIRRGRSYRARGNSVKSILLVLVLIVDISLIYKTARSNSYNTRSSYYSILIYLLQDIYIIISYSYSLYIRSLKVEYNLRFRPLFINLQQAPQLYTTTQLLVSFTLYYAYTNYSLPTKLQYSTLPYATQDSLIQLTLISLY